VRAEFANMRQFAFNFAVQSLHLPVAVLILLYIYGTISGGRALGHYSALKLALYFIGVAVSTQVAMPALTTMWESWEQINSGELSIYLCRPVDTVWFRFARKLAPALVMGACAAAIQTAVRLVLGTWSPTATIQFLLGALLSFSLWFMWWFLLGAVSFWWERPFGMRDILWNVVAILSGQMFPVDLLHPALQRMIRWLPFQGLTYVPASLFAGSLSGANAWAALGQQAVWLVALTAAARAVWGAGIRLYDGRGG
jgi:ABC-2 type transport system permease protein